MNSRYLRSIVRMVVFVLALTVVLGVVSGCGAGDSYVGSFGPAGIFKISKQGDTYLIHDPGNPFGNDYSGKMENGKLVAKAGPATLVYTMEGDWLVSDYGMRWEKN